MSIRRLLQEAVDQLKDDGVKTIEIESLELWLASVGDKAEESNQQTREFVHQSNLAKFHANSEANLSQYRANCETSLELFRSVIRISEFAIRWVIIVSGSGCIALLGLIGSIWATPGSADYIRVMLSTLCWFGGATFLSLISAGFLYFAQSLYHKSFDEEVAGKDQKGRLRKFGHVLRTITVILAFSAVGCLAVGSISLAAKLAKQLAAPSMVKENKDVSNKIQSTPVGDKDGETINELLQQACAGLWEMGPS
ncbi:MAG: hypothetical protein JXR25_11070 [Pontiellaceae bacterium]|nr:hypothetical protein [Pontiellaceae bacterium]